MSIELKADLVIHDDKVPLRKDELGAIRVGRSRITLEFLVAEFNRDNKPEQLVGKYPTLELADVYAAIGYYLRHKAEVDEYCRRVELEAEELRKRVEAVQGPPRVTREMLEARWKEREARRAAADQ